MVKGSEKKSKMQKKTRPDWAPKEFAYAVLRPLNRVSFPAQTLSAK